MKNIHHIFCAALLAFSVSSCETNNIFDDLGTSDGSIVANVYMEALAPKLQAGVTKEMEVQFWSTDDDFLYLGLWDYVSLDQVFEVTVQGVQYESSEREDFQDWEEYQEYSFDFANWTPESSAYVRKVSYQIDLAYDNVTKTKSNLSVDEFLQEVPESFQTDLFSYYTTKLTRTTLNDLMIDNSVMTQGEFDGHYGENGFLTESGKTAVAAGLQQIGVKTLIGDTYKIGNEYQITLAFRATNGSQKSNEYRRSFVVF